MNSFSTVLAGLLLFLPSLAVGEDANPEASLALSPKPARIKVGEEISIRVEVREAKDLFGAPFYLLYDSNLLEVIKVSDGDFLKKDGKKTAFLYKIDPKKGRIIVGQTRLGNVGGADGKGTLATVRFKALRVGHAALSFEEVGFKDSHQASLPIQAENGTIEVIETREKEKEKSSPDIPRNEP